MKRKLLLLNTVLLGLLILGGADLYSKWLQAEARYASLSKYADEKAAPEFPAGAGEPMVRPGAYMPIVERLLFSKDRNSVVEVVVAEPEVEQRPALPFFSGLVDFGDGPLALMSATNAQQGEWIAIGEKVGEFTFRGLAEDGRVKLSWKDQEITVEQSELTGAGAAPAQQQAGNRRPPRPKPGQAPAAAPPANATANLAQQAPATVGGQYNIGKELRPGVFAADPKDTAPDGTEHKDYVKRVRKTPFGSQSWWEKKK